MPPNENSALFDNDLLSIFLVICLALTEKSRESKVFCIFYGRTRTLCKLLFEPDTRE
jgi:hypothetical protein